MPKKILSTFGTSYNMITTLKKGSAYSTTTNKTKATSMTRTTHDGTYDLETGGIDGA